ncbi:MAG: pyrroline-5-carboxylate reductase [Lysobacteraceae bacterium]
MTSFPLDTPRIALIGGGNVARSLVGGLVALGVPASSLAVSGPNAERRAAFVRDFGVHAHADNIKTARTADVWVLAVKPQVLRSVCEELAEQAYTQRPLIVSVAAGITTAQVERWLGIDIAIVRAMPNTPALLGASATALCANQHASSLQCAQAQRLFEAVGTAVWIDDETLMDTVTATSGSGPAYVFALVEAMQAAAQSQGLPEDIARALIAQTILGAGRMLIESGEDAATLRQRVTSPGGVTAEALKRFAAGGFRALIAEGIAAATSRGAELSAAND